MIRRFLRGRNYDDKGEGEGEENPRRGFRQVVVYSNKIMGSMWTHRQRVKKTTTIYSVYVFFRICVSLLLISAGPLDWH
jgi:hypothetical protein